MKTVIMAAGFGSRLWPVSTSDRPKQFQPLLGDDSLLQYSYKLYSQLTPINDLYVLTLSGLEHHVYEQLPDLPKENVLIVPERRNTLPHSCFALNRLELTDSEPVLITSVDLFFPRPEEFLNSLRQFTQEANDLKLIELLCTNEPGYDASSGYVTVDESFVADTFVEKPTQAEFEVLQHAGHVYRNSSLCITSRQTMLASLESVGTDVSKAAAELLQAPDGTYKETFLATPFSELGKQLYEKADQIQVRLIDGAFVDVGRFETVHALGEKDALGNVTAGAVHLSGDSSNNLILNQLEQPLAVIDLKDSVVVQTSSGTVVTTMAAADSVGRLYKEQILPSS